MDEILTVQRLTRTAMSQTVILSSLQPEQI
jgi:hypothetical protein